MVLRLPFASSFNGKQRRVVVSRPSHHSALTLLQHALQSLPAPARTAFERYRFDGASRAEIAQEMGLSTAQVDRMIRQALVHCRQTVID